MAGHRNLWRGVLACLMLLLTTRSAFAHPMGNFSISHYTRLEPFGDHIEGRYVLDMAEIPTVTEMSRLDTNGDGKVSPQESAAYLRVMCAQLGGNLTLTLNGQNVPLDARPDGLALRPGAGGLQTLRLTLKLNVRLPAPTDRALRLVEYRDENFPQRTGWKEIVVTGPSGLVRSASVPSEDISKELTYYPADPGIAPPQNTQAQFTLLSASTPGSAEPTRFQSSDARSAGLPLASVPPISPAVNSATPQDRFTQSIAAPGLTPALMLLALGSAFAFGALHALSPGHGKVMVAAYLVGTQGTAWHAVLLGLVVTLTHTVGVFALGLITLSASKHIVPERLYPIISGLSGLGVACMGIGLLYARLTAWRIGRNEAEETDKTDSEKEGAQASETNETDEFLYQRRNGNSASLRTLIGLGVTGGALPCPSALVVMLSAIALHRIGFGLLLIVSFSLGLAVVLTVLGLVVMRARGVAERFPQRGRVMAGLSVASAGVVTLIGLALCVRALSGGF